MRTRFPTRLADATMKGTKITRTQVEMPAQSNDREGDEDEGKELLQEFRQHARHRELHTLYVVHDC